MLSLNLEHCRCYCRTFIARLYMRSTRFLHDPVEVDPSCSHGTLFLLSHFSSRGDSKTPSHFSSVYLPHTNRLSSHSIKVPYFCYIRLRLLLLRQPATAGDFYQIYRFVCVTIILLRNPF